MWKVMKKMFVEKKEKKERIKERRKTTQVKEEVKKNLREEKSIFCSSLAKQGGERKSGIWLSNECQNRMDG